MRRIELEDAEAMSFLEDIEKVCKKHGFSIAHEDMHGAFIVEPYSIYNIEWLKAALLPKNDDTPTLEK